MNSGNHIKTMLAASIICLLTSTSIAQCDFFAKRAVPKLKPYVNTSQLYNTALLANDKTELPMTFYYGDEYRIIIKADEKLGKIQFNLRDASNKVVFTTKGYGIIQWDFNVEATQDMTIEVITPVSENKTTIENADKPVLDVSGCVAILVGFK